MEFSSYETTYSDHLAKTVNAYCMYLKFKVNSTEINPEVKFSIGAV